MPLRAWCHYGQAVRYLFVDETVEVHLLYELPVLGQQEPRSDLNNRKEKQTSANVKKSYRS